MFTGIIQELGTVVEMKPYVEGRPPSAVEGRPPSAVEGRPPSAVEGRPPSAAQGARLVVKRRSREKMQKGESIAVDGVCLTVASARNGTFTAELSPETLTRTALRNVAIGAKVNLERPLRLTDRLGGHLVQGHVDAVGRLVESRRQGDFVTCRWIFPSEFAPLVIAKGSIAVNGVSLTIVEPDETSFAAALIPETVERTNLGLLGPGDPVNLEFDVIGKFVLRLAQPYRGEPRR